MSLYEIFIYDLSMIQVILRLADRGPVEERVPRIVGFPVWIEEIETQVDGDNNKPVQYC